MTITRKSKTEQLLEQLKARHEWREGGYSQWEACGITGTDTCRICGLRHTTWRNGQNSEDDDTFEDSKKNRLTLREALDLPACIDEE